MNLCEYLEDNHFDVSLAKAVSGVYEKGGFVGVCELMLMTDRDTLEEVVTHLLEWKKVYGGDYE